MIDLRSESTDDTRAIAAAIAGLARAGDLIVLAGQMGAGKTAFAQGFARSLGVIEPVTSPTYTLVHTYPARIGPARIGPARIGPARIGLARIGPARIGPARNSTATATGMNTNSITLHHADLYRLQRIAEVDDLALPELLEDDAVMLVEWGDKVDLGPQLQIELRLPAADQDEIDDEGGDGVCTTDAREITVTSSDKRWDLRWERLAAALQRWAG